MHRHLNVQNTVKHMLSNMELKERIEEEMYKRDRYHIDSTIALVSFSKEEIAPDVLNYIRDNKLIRIVDKAYIIPDLHMIAIFYCFSGEKESFKAAQNLLLQLELYLNYCSNLKIGLSSCKKKHTQSDWINQVVKNLKDSFHEHGDTITLDQH